MDIKIHSIGMWTAELNRLFGKTSFKYEKVPNSDNLGAYIVTKFTPRLLVGTFNNTMNVGFIHDRRGNVRSSDGKPAHEKASYMAKLRLEDYSPGKLVNSSKRRV